MFFRVGIGVIFSDSLRTTSRTSTLEDSGFQSEPLGRGLKFGFCF